MFDTAEWGTDQSKLRCPLCRGPLRIAVAHTILIVRGLDIINEDENHLGYESRGEGEDIV